MARPTAAKQADAAHRAQRSAKKAKQSKLRQLFDSIDADGSGLLDKDELAVLAAKLGRTLGPAELDSAMTEMDTDQSGEVDFEEFEEWWTKSAAGERSSELAKAAAAQEAAAARIQAVHRGRLLRAAVVAASSAGARELMAMPAAERARLQPSELRRRALAVGLPDATALDAWPWTCGVHAAALDAGLVARLPARLSPG